MIIKKADRKSSRSEIYNSILDNIQYCKWVPGTPISETMLADMFQVSRTPIRQALLLLSQNGFVDIYPQSGSYVSKIDIKRLREIQYLRYHVETPVFMELARKKTPIPENIEKMLLLEEFAAKKGNWMECVQLDYSIHEELYALADHTQIWELIRPELPHYTRIRFFESSYMEFKGEQPRTLQEHKDIVACIAAGDTGGLQKALDTHHDHIFTIHGEHKFLRIQQDQFERIKKHPEYFCNLDLLKI